MEDMGRAGGLTFPPGTVSATVKCLSFPTPRNTFCVTAGDLGLYREGVPGSSGLMTGFLPLGSARKKPSWARGTSAGLPGAHAATHVGAGLGGAHAGR